MLTMAIRLLPGFFVAEQAAPLVAISVAYGTLSAHEYDQLCDATCLEARTTDREKCLPICPAWRRLVQPYR